MALVYYTVIGDRDDPAHPNAFPLDKPLDSILVGDIAECFPLAGEFHFRFKIKYDAFGFVWLDLQDYNRNCLLYTSDAADEEDSVDLGGRRIIKKKKKKEKKKKIDNKQKIR
eukprot:TRINITY_DN19993_c0_g1_i2.p1 TRINITY_DN19993_c0_g1~~TRINITY_DN19993_c0_g1_i2.p1  ORF type:complete len:112 (+),score=37.54 TRINITY_DN19993_c0_g1_i2:36-371(+)